MAELILNEKPLIITIDDFMDHEDCDAIVEFTKRKLERSKVVNYGEGGRNKIDKYRTSSEHFIGETFEPNVFHRNSVAEYFETSKDTFEKSIVIRYKEGQEYRPHFDFFNPGSKEQRRATAICYLNDCAEGGVTIFPRLDISYKPKKGSVLYFQYDYDTETNKKTFHGGSPVIGNNEKWILTIWMRYE